ncbi:MAG: nucleotidyltransferase [Symploca sp. SIO2E6]|nr:nucleotidyltransferase [Symploca sp. SIO2E6]
MLVTNIEIPEDQIKHFCQRWKISEFALFGSVLRDDFRSDSDIDTLVTFTPDAHHTLLDLVDMERELPEIFRRDVDLMSKKGVERSRNYLRPKAILNSAEIIYVAPGD